MKNRKINLLGHCIRNDTSGGMDEVKRGRGIRRMQFLYSIEENAQPEHKRQAPDEWTGLNLA